MSLLYSTDERDSNIGRRRVGGGVKETERNIPSHRGAEPTIGDQRGTSEGAPDELAVSPQMVASIRSTARAYFLTEEGDGTGLLERIIAEAIRASDDTYGEAAAVQWGNGYQFPRELVDSDVRCFQAAQLDFVAMVRRRLKTLEPTRLNASRVNGLRADNPESRLMMELATKGMYVPKPVDFKTNGQETPAPLRASYLKVHQAVDRMLADTVQRRLAFLLPKQMALEAVPNLHLATAHWAPKKGKASGRPIGDLSHVAGMPLNTPATTAAAEAHYGRIEHPTIEDIVRMVNEFHSDRLKLHPDARWTDLRLWKMDLRGAYTLLSFAPEDTALFAMELANDLVYFQFVGIFGWSCTPAAFQTVTRAIKFELKHKLKSRTLMYVDDVIGVGLATDIEEDIRLCTEACTQLLGPDAVATEKTEHGLRVEVIGYVIDLGRGIVSIARKNFLNTLYGFLQVDLLQPVSLKTAQRLASWASRYGLICRALRPFCSALNQLLVGRLHRHATIPLTEEARIAVRMWRAMLYLVEYDEIRFTRTLQSFIHTPARYVVEFDASLTGIGFLLFERTDGDEACLGGAAVDIRSLGFEGNSSFQNLAEYVGALVGILGLVQLGIRCRDIEMRGDSVAALTWAHTERISGTRVTNAAMVFTSACLKYGMDVKTATHIAGKDNFRCDSLSRLVESGLSARTVMDDLGFTESGVVDLEVDPSFQRLVLLCNPERTFADEGSFTVFWGEIRDALTGFNGEA